MTTRYSPGSGLPPISDDLLSAYLDGQVTPAERQRVEKALAEDPAVRERYMMLRQTVLLLRQTPRVAVPRSFVLSEAQVLAAGGRVAGVERPGLFARLLAGMSMALPVATAAVAVAFFLVVGVDVWRTQFGAPAASAPAALSASQPNSQPEAAAPVSPAQEKAAVQGAKRQPEPTQAPAAAPATETQPSVDQPPAESVAGEPLAAQAQAEAPTVAAAVAEATAALADVGQALAGAGDSGAAATMVAEPTPEAAVEGALEPAPQAVREAAPEAAAAAKMAGEEPPGVAAAAALAPEPMPEMTSAVAPAQMGPAVLTETVTVSPTMAVDTFALETETPKSASKQEPVATLEAEAMPALQAAPPESASAQSESALAAANAVAITATAQLDMEPTPLPTATPAEAMQAVEPTVIPTQSPAIRVQEPATPTPIPTPEPAAAVIAQPEQSPTEPPAAKVVAQPTAVVIAAAGDQNAQAAGQAPAAPATAASLPAPRVSLRTVEAGLVALLVVLVGATLLVHRRRAWR